MPRKKKEFSEEENFEVEEILEEVSEEIIEEKPAIEEKEEEIAVPDKHEYRILFLLSGNNAVAVRKEDGRTISKTISRTSSMKIGDIIEI